MKNAGLSFVVLMVAVVVIASGCPFQARQLGEDTTSTSSTGGNTGTREGCEQYASPTVMNCGTIEMPVCTDLQDNLTTCGACGNVCQTNAFSIDYGCFAGKCGYSQKGCTFPYADCDHDIDLDHFGDDSNGCETNLANDPKYCGGCEAYRACKPGQICVVGKCEDPSGSGGAGGGTTTGAGGSGTGGQGGAGGGCSVNKKYCGNPAMCTVQTVENGCSSPACDASCFKANNSDGSMCDGLGGPCLVICEQAKQDTAGHLDCDGDANNPAGNGCEFDLHNASRCTCPGDGNPDCPQGKKCGTVQVNGVWMPTCL